MRGQATNFNPANVAISGGTISGTAISGGTMSGTALSAVTGVPTKQISNGIAFINVSTGSMGNNGALTAITALPRTYSEGAYIFLPAGAIAAGVPAAGTWYWCVFSSATAGTVFNSTYTSGVPVVGTATAFATTGPGAFTGVTTEVTMITYNLASAAMGTQGCLDLTTKWTMTNNANAKTGNTKLGGSNISTNGTTLTSLLNVIERNSVQNRGSSAVQIGTVSNTAFYGLGASGSGDTYMTVDTSGVVAVARTSTKATATDNIILEQVTDLLIV